MIPVPGFENARVAILGLGRSGLSAARALLVGGSSLSYSGPAHASSQFVVSSIAPTGSCHPFVCSNTKSFTSLLGALVSERAVSSSTRTLSCHMLFGGVPSDTFAARNGIVNSLDRPSTV